MGGGRAEESNPSLAIQSRSLRGGLYPNMVKSRGGRTELDPELSS
jgi:hypothetical protein